MMVSVLLFQSCHSDVRSRSERPPEGSGTPKVLAGWFLATVTSILIVRCPSCRLLSLSYLNSLSSASEQFYCSSWGSVFPESRVFRLIKTINLSAYKPISKIIFFFPLRHSAVTKQFCSSVFIVMPYSFNWIFEECIDSDNHLMCAEGSCISL